MAIELFGLLYTVPNIKQPIVVATPEEVSAGIPILEDAKDITLAQYDRHTKDVLTAHKIKDYRCKKFSVVLVPDVEILFDKLVEGSGLLNEKLQNASAYT